MNNAIAVRSPSQLDPATHAECLGFIRAAIASNDLQTAHDIAAVLKDCRERGYIDRVALWADLSQAEQQCFKQLLTPPPEPITLPADPELEPEPEPAPEVEEADAAKMRDIALVWWPEMYPECLQSLVTQLWGWGAPARKYSAVQIARWLEEEDEVVKYRIGELMAIGLADNYKEDEENE